MYFLSVDFFHTILALLFLFITFGVIFFRYNTYFSANKKTTNYTTNKKWVITRLVSLVLTIIFLSTIILEPAWLMEGSEITKEWIDCIWLLDVSASMDVVDVIDNNQTVSRLTRAKSVIENFIISHREARYGLVIFAGKSRLVSPLTSEHSSLLSFLASIDSKSISEGGTDFREAVALSIERFETKNPIPHAIILLSDGGDQEDAPDMNSIKNLFQKKHTNLITIGIWQTNLSPIPVGRNPFGDTVYKKFNGETVLSGLTRKTLQDLAKNGWWSYIEWASIENSLEKSLSRISRHPIKESWDNVDDLTVRIFAMLGFFFFLMFILFPSSPIKKWNAI